MAPREPPEAELSFQAGATGEMLEQMIRLFAVHGDIYRAYVPARGSYTYVVHHPDDVKRVLVSNHENYSKGFEADRIRMLLGMGLMTSEGDLWARQRHMMQPLFHKRMVESFCRVIGEENDALIAQWNVAAAQQRPVDVTEAMSELTLRIMLRCIFGGDAAQLAGRFGVVSVDPARNLDFVYKFRALRGDVSEVVQRRRAAPGEHCDYVALLMSARDKRTGEGMGERQLIDEIMTLVVAGHETTASVLNWTWYLIARNAHVESHLRTVLGGRAPLQVPRLTELESFPYCRQVLDEAMRLYPPGWLLSRRAIAPDVLGGYAIPANAEVLLPLYLLHRDPRYWSSPDEFRPERFAAHSAADSSVAPPGRSRFAYLPFAAGPRRCIGESLARCEMLMHLYKLIPRFHPTLIEDKPPELDAQINLRSRGPITMRMQPL